MVVRWDRTPFSIGTHISANEDPRHVGRVIAVFNRYQIRVAWLDTGWKSDLHVDHDKVEHAIGD